ncbi:hypothetical protein CR513_10138, partial [Mucuna pruriens]
MAKLKKYYKRWVIRTRADSLRTLYGHIELRTKLCWGCLLTKFLSSPDQNRTSSLLGSQAMQPGLRPSQKTKEAPATRTRRTPLGSIRELHDLQAKGKLHSKWDGPFVITNVFPYDVLELKDENTNNTF